MTNKMKLIFVIAATVSAVVSMLISTQFAVDIADQALSAVTNTLGLPEVPALFVLAVLVIPGLYLCLAFMQRRPIT
jgi:TRAP-type C4-dicarboxylate transport system permease small subunit